MYQPPKSPYSYDSYALTFYLRVIFPCEYPLCQEFMKLGFESALDKRALKRNTSGFFLKQIAQNGLRSTTYQYLTSKTHKRFLLLHLFFPFLFFFFFYLLFMTCMCGMKPSLTSMMLSSLMKSLTETRKFGYNISHIYQDLNKQQSDHKKQDERRNRLISSKGLQSPSNCIAS